MSAEPEPDQRARRVVQVAPDVGQAFDQQQAVPVLTARAEANGRHVGVRPVVGDGDQKPGGFRRRDQFDRASRQP